MKILLFTDNHFCEKSSILQGYGTRYSLRLENQIKTQDWIEQTALSEGCEMEICLGDFFDKPDLNQFEITAAKDIRWNSLPHYFIVGNHESGLSSLECSSVKYLESGDRKIVSEVMQMKVGDCDLSFIPYVTEADRKPLAETLKQLDGCSKRVILSHNDIKGIQMGPVVSKTGYDLADIDVSCDLFINGHLHNGQKVSAKAMNLGNATGKDFGEDADRYPHRVMVLDTDSLETKMIENPVALNFYKIDLDERSCDILRLSKLKGNAVVSIKTPASLLEQVKEKIDTNKSKILASRTIVSREASDGPSDLSIDDLRSGDHLSKLVDFCRERLGQSEVLEQELSEICR